MSTTKILFCICLLIGAATSSNALTDDASTIALWHMDTASPNVLDDDVNNPGRENDLVLVNGTALVAGQSGYGNALSFDGYDDHAATNGDAWKDTRNDVKIDFWVKPSLSNSAAQYLINAMTDKLVWDVRLVNGKVSFYTVNSAEVIHLLESSTTYTVNEWHRIICSVDAAGNKVVNLDGSIATAATDPMRYRNAKINIGSALGRTDRSFTGLLDEIKISIPSRLPVALSDSPETVALWHMNGTIGNMPPFIEDDDGANPNRNSDLVLFNNPSISSSLGGLGQALLFNDPTQLCIAYYPAWKGIWNDVKIDFWFRPTISSGASQYIIYAFGSKLIWDVRLVNGKISFYTVNSANVAHLLESSIPYTINEWHHAICSIDIFGNKVVNLDGALATANVDVMRFRDGDITIGGVVGRTDRSFTGLLDEICISTPSLAPLTGEWQKPYQDNPTTQGLWHFDQELYGEEVYKTQNSNVYYTPDDDRNCFGISREHAMVLMEVNYPALSASEGPAIVLNDISSQDPNLTGFGYCYRFDENDYLIVDTLSAMEDLDVNKRNLRAEAWIKNEAPTNSNNSVYTIAYQRSMWKLRLVDTSDGWQFHWIVYGTDNIARYNVANYVNDGKWHHVAGTFNNGVSTVYVDGRQLGAVSLTTGLRPSSARFQIGSEALGACPFTGKIDEVRISEAVPSEPRCGFEGYLEADMNHDCHVNFTDLMILVNNWLNSAGVIVEHSLNETMFNFMEGITP